MKKFFWLIALAPSVLFAQNQKINDDILISGKTPENFYNPLPRVLKWVDNDKVIANMKPSESEGQKNVMLNLKNGKFEDFSSDLLTKTIEPRLRIVKEKGDLFIISGNTKTRITQDPDKEEKNPTFSPDSNYVAYSKDNNLYTYNLATKKETQLTTDGTKTILNGFATWLYWEEIFGRSTAFRAFWWSPDSKTLAFMRFDETNTPMFPIYSSEGQHGHLEETRYPKAGDVNPTAKVGFTKPDKVGVTWADFNDQDDQYFGWPKWSLDSKGLMLQWINRGNDNLKIYNVSPENGSKKLVYEETQKEWISIDEADERLTLLDNGNEMVIISDKTGWKQLYLYSVDGKLKNKITDGKYTVTRVFGIDQKERVVYFHARGLESSARFDLYRVGLDGKNLKRLTFGDFNHRQINASPDLKYFSTTYSNLKTPTAVTIIDNTGKRIKELGSLQGSEFSKYKINNYEQVRVKSNDGKFDLPMNILYPENMETGKKYPLMISIYGGPDAGTVYDQWSWTPRAQWFAREGAIQVTMDHRASGHFGKEGVAYMHRNLSKYEMEDYITLTKHLISKGIVDESKIFMTGFSYGGYMTSMALTKHADVFTHGIAGGSVTDWGLYDTAYTERFMDKPSENPEGYRNNNVMNFVDTYKGKLLIVHGTMDDNVHLQNSIQLIDALQEKKKDFEMMFYPGGRHGWGGNKGIHYSNLQTQFIYKNLFEKPIPNGFLR
jgi:dipeptidyl-peptidase-4